MRRRKARWTRNLNSFTYWKGVGVRRQRAFHRKVGKGENLLPRKREAEMKAGSVARLRLGNYGGEVLLKDCFWKKLEEGK